MKAFITMLKTDLKLSLRGVDVLVFSIFMPIVVTIVIGLVFGSKPAHEGAEYTFVAQSFGALSAIGILVGGAMGLPLSVSAYRARKILKRFKVTPVSPVMILIVQLIVLAIYAVASLICVYITAAVLFGYSMIGSLGAFLASYFLTMISMFSIGMMVGGIAPNEKIAGVIASLLYFPMLIFSGTTLPYDVMPEALQKVSDFLPMTQGIKLLQATSLGLPVGDVMLPIIVMLAITVVCSTIAIKFFKWE